MSDFLRKDILLAKMQGHKKFPLLTENLL